MRYGLDMRPAKTQREIARELGYSADETRAMLESGALYVWRPEE